MYSTWRDASTIGTHLVNAVAIAVQRCNGMALQRVSGWSGMWRWGHVRRKERSDERCVGMLLLLLSCC